MYNVSLISLKTTNLSRHRLRGLEAQQLLNITEKSVDIHLIRFLCNSLTNTPTFHKCAVFDSPPFQVSWSGAALRAQE